MAFLFFVGLGVLRIYGSCFLGVCGCSVSLNFAVTYCFNFKASLLITFGVTSGGLFYGRSLLPISKFWFWLSESLPKLSNSLESSAKISVVFVGCGSYECVYFFIGAGSDERDGKRTSYSSTCSKSSNTALATIIVLLLWNSWCTGAGAD